MSKDALLRPRKSKHALDGVDGFVKRSGEEYLFDPRKFIRDETKNSREPGSYGKCEDDLVMKEAMRQNGMLTFPPLYGQKMNDGSILLRRGFRRHWCAMSLIAEGVDIKACRLKLVDKDTTDDEALIQALADGQTKRESPLEEATVYLRLKNNGWDVKYIARRLGRPVSHIYERLKLVKASPETREAIKNGTVGVTDATRGIAEAGADPYAQRQAINKIQKRKMAGRIKWDRQTKCLVSNGFTPEQENVLAELMPSGFSDKLRSVGLDPESFKLVVAEKVA